MTWTPLELFANLATVICIFLAGRNSIHTWWTGIIACVLFGWLFYDAKLYADVTLQVFFVATGIIGWVKWANRSTIAAVTEENRRTYVGGLLMWGGVAVIVAGIYGTILHYFTDAYAPFVDSAVLAFSVLGQILLMRRDLATWPVWVIVNTLSVPLYLSRELYLTAGLYAVFWVHAIYATFHWYNLQRAQTK